MLRLAVLKSWTYFSVGEAAAFVDTMNALNEAAAPVANNVNKDLLLNTNLRIVPDKNALPIVANALNMGYVPLNHDLRAVEKNGTRDKTVSWYRGPLTPYQPTKASIKLPIASPDQATIFDPATGMFDVSYAAAWTLGRQMAIQDKAFSVALYNWKKGLTNDIINKTENEILAQALAALFAPVEEKALAIQNAGMVKNAMRLNAAVEEKIPAASINGSVFLKTILSLKKKNN
jgi:hypothetical protein